MNDALHLALEHPANDLRDIFSDLYPDAPVRRGRTRAVWRGGDGENVAVYRRSLHDFVSSETYSTWRFLTELAGFSKAQAAEHLLGRAGLVSDAQRSPEAQRRAAVKSRSREAAEKRLEAYRSAQLAQAHKLQKTAPATGMSRYLERKGVAAIFAAHRVAPAALAGSDTRETVPGLVYSSDNYGPFVQLVLRDLEGNVTGYQRLYDGERGKQFVAGTKPKGAFVLLEPKAEKLPRDGTALAELLEGGFEVALCEGFATGSSVALARPKTFAMCTLSAGNLGPVTEALRKYYGYQRSIDEKLKAINLTIWADNDKSGTGQTAAHRAALKSGCYVRVPKFKKGYGDFNDLHAAQGLEAVKRTRKVTPDATLAFAKELGKQKLSPDKHLAPFALPDAGAGLIVRAPQETGKTHRLAELLSGQGLRVLVVTHRESLAKNLAARLRFECYQDYSAHLLRSIPRLVICFDSLQKLTIGGDLPSYDLLVLDESEQVLEHTTGRHIKRKAANFGAFEHYLKTAPRIICADANAGKLTADALKRYSPERRVAWHIHEHHVGKERKLRLTFDRDDVLDELEAETRPAWVAADSLRFTRDLSSYLDDPATLTINSETSGTDAAKEYLLDPTGQAPRYSRMIASPSVQTGLSDDSGHWQHIMGSFGGFSSTPQDAMQALMRARRVPQLTIYATRGQGNPVTVQEALDGAAAADDHEAGALQREDYGAKNPNYERLRAEIEASRSKRQGNYRERLVLEAVRLGYTVKVDVARDLHPGQLEARGDRSKALKEAGLARYVCDRVGAERINEARAKALDEQFTLSQADYFALEQYQARAFYRLPDDTSDGDLAELLRVDDYKALRRKIELYENFIEPRDVAEARAQGDLEGGVLRGDAKAHMLRFDYHRQLGRVIGLDAESEAQVETWQRETERLTAKLEQLSDEAKTAQTRRKGELNRQVAKLEANLIVHKSKTLTTTYNRNDEAARAFLAWAIKHYRALNHEGLVTASLNELKAKPLATINDSLKRCGLAPCEVQKSNGVKRYGVLLVSVSEVFNYSRPRREKWQFGPEKDIKTLDNTFRPKTDVSASRTGLITALQNLKGGGVAQNTPDDLIGWLESGKLDDFGSQKLAIIRQKVAENDMGWLHTLANSRPTGRMLGVVR